ncbi:hypothetical protein BIW11_04048 [Tropilaelaps mercedesae]|uniref:Uncharacterized protein n=1 Tax=Tropilaelaps mercedesae TaxID=418985 RepID=A0A1V9XBX5_9ACAR|nr:hypothetical protein BIW11_04048 [Tropilaelaps mercedesae]
MRTELFPTVQVADSASLLLCKGSRLGNAGNTLELRKYVSHLPTESTASLPLAPHRSSLEQILFIACSPPRPNSLQYAPLC